MSSALEGKPDGEDEVSNHVTIDERAESCTNSRTVTSNLTPFWSSASR